VETLAAEGVVTVSSVACDKENHFAHAWVADYTERLEGENARKECLDSYEYYAIMATLPA
jgi:hypothetical protein